jgi:hypothetical protein
MNLSTINLSLQRSLLANPTGANEKIRFKVDSYYPDVTKLPNGVRENFEKHQRRTPSVHSLRKFFPLKDPTNAIYSDLTILIITKRR